MRRKRIRRRKRKEKRGEERVRVGKWRESEDQNEELRSHYESPCQTLS